MKSLILTLFWVFKCLQERVGLGVFAQRKRDWEVFAMTKPFRQNFCQFRKNLIRLLVMINVQKIWLNIFKCLRCDDQSLSTKFRPISEEPQPATKYPTACDDQYAAHNSKEKCLDKSQKDIKCLRWPNLFEEISANFGRTSTSHKVSGCLWWSMCKDNFE